MIAKESKKTKRVRKRLKSVIEKQTTLVTERAIKGEKSKIQNRFERMKKERPQVADNIVEESPEIKDLAKKLEGAT
ncbi:MAG: hypothetical protein K940chlam8_00661 [Chlamydiae bacterium]|nr:hypothetical protein [Chlamydiota bacterium]